MMISVHTAHGIGTLHVFGGCKKNLSILTRNNRSAQNFSQGVYLHGCACA